MYGDEAEAIVAFSYIDKNITIYSNGLIDNFYKNYSPKMKYSGGLFNFPHSMCIEYDLNDSHPEDVYIIGADYYNKERNEGKNDLLYLYVTTDAMPKGRCAYELKFEKVE